MNIGEPSQGKLERLQFLARGAEQDLIDVHVLRLAHGEGDHARKRFGGERHLVRHLADALPNVALGDPVNEFRIERSGRDHRRADVVGLHLHPQTFGDDPHGVLGRRVDHAASPYLMAAVSIRR